MIETRINARWPVIADVAILTGVVVAMVAIDSDWVFSWKNWIDTWMYVGYFQHYGSPDFLPGNKKIARLPWILLGYGVTKLTGPLVASYVLHAGLLLGGCLAFYRVALRLFGRSPAILTALVYLTTQTMHGAGGWDYHDTFTPLLYFLTYAALDAIAANGRLPLLRFGLFGALYALTVHTNLFTLLLAPALVIHFVFRRRMGDAAPLSTADFTRCVGAIAAGAVSLTAILGLINLAVGRQFFFFEILFARSAFLLSNPDQERSWWLPWSNDWWAGDLQTPLLEAILVLAFVAVAIFIVQRTTKGTEGKPIPLAIVVHVEFLISFVIFAFFQTIGHPVLQPDYMAFPLYLPMFLSLSGLISSALQANRESAGRLDAKPILLTTLAAAAAVLIVAEVSFRLTLNSDFFQWGPRDWYNKPPLLLLMASLAVGALIARLPSSRAIVRMATAVVAFIWLAATMGEANAEWPGNPNRWASYEPGNSCSWRRSIFSAVIDADKVLFPVAEAGHEVMVWYPSHELDGPSTACQQDPAQVGRPLYAMGYGGDLHYWDVDSATDMTPAFIDSLSPGRDDVALVTDDDRYVTAQLNQLKRRNPSWHQIGQYHLGQGAITYELHLLAGTTPLSTTLTFRAPVQHGAIETTLATGGLEISLPHDAWSYAAQVIVNNPPSTLPGTIVLHLRVVSGTAAVGFLNPAGSDFVTRQILLPTPGAVDVDIPVTSWTGVGALMLETAQSGGGKVLISRVAFQTEP